MSYKRGNLDENAMSAIAESPSYKIWKKERDALYVILDKANKIMNAYPTGRGQLGMVTDEARATEDYVENKRAYSIAFENVRNFNMMSPDNFGYIHSKLRRLAKIEANKGKWENE